MFLAIKIVKNRKETRYFRDENYRMSNVQHYTTTKLRAIKGVRAREYLALNSEVGIAAGRSMR